MRNPVNIRSRLRAVVMVGTIVMIALITAQSLPKSESGTKQYFLPQDFIVPIPTVQPTPTPAINQALEAYSDFKEALGKVNVTYSYTYTELEYEYIGTYFITAYCPSECGWNGDPDNLTGWHTASDTICHRAGYEDRLYEPTTCAIDRNYHSFGDLFYVEGFDRVFVAEDTGSAVKGHHLDLFYEDYDDVLTFPTGYYDVYSVEYVTSIRTTTGGIYGFIDYIYDNVWCNWNPDRYGTGKHNREC